MKNFRIIQFTMFSLLALTLSAKGKTEQRPNIVVVLADDMRLDYLGCMGLNDIVKTPNLDKLASEGFLFNNAFVTSSICTPSRTCIMTGQYERKHGITFGANSAMTNEAFAKTYPMLLKNSGYYTGWVGKNHTPIGSTEQGFGYKSGVMDSSFDYWYAGHGHLTFYPKGHHPIFKDAKADNQIDIIQESIDAFFNGDAALANTREFLNTRPADKPFCLLVNFNVPHSSSTNSMEQRESDPELYKSVYRDQIDEMPLPPTYESYADRQAKLPKDIYTGEYLSSYDFVKSEASLRENQVRTCQTVNGIDNVVGEIIKELKEEGELENTVILFTSDHGLFHGEHGMGGKTFGYEELLRIPLIIYLPQQKKAGVEINEMSLTIDLAPTILELAGVETPGIMQGESLMPLIKGKSKGWREDFFIENMFMGQNYPRYEGVRSEEWKYIRYYAKENDQHHVLSLIAPFFGEKAVYEELYHLTVDPLEKDNVVELSENKEILEHFRSRCDVLLHEAKGDAKVPDTYIKGWSKDEFRTKVEAKYKELEAQF